MELPIKFYSRGLEIVEQLRTEVQDVVIVATRSVLVLLASVCMGRTVEPGGGYREIPWPNLGYASFQFSDDGIVLNRNMSSVEIN